MFYAFCSESSQHFAKFLTLKQKHGTTRFRKIQLHPLLCEKAVIQWSRLVIFFLLPSNTYQWRFRVQQRTIKNPANYSSHCALAARSLPSHQRQAPERACTTFTQISNHIYDQLINMLEFFSSRFMHYNLDMRPLKGNHSMFCDIQIFSATTTTTAEALHFNIQELAIVECSGHMHVKFCVVFVCAKKILCGLFMRK